MDQMEKEFRELLRTYKANRDKVPVSVLRTKYGQAYRKLVGDIKDSAKRMATRLPDWMACLPGSPEAARMLAEAFNRTYEAGGYKKRLGGAIFVRMDADEAVGMIREINQRFWAAAEAAMDKTMCMVAPVGPDGKLMEPCIISREFMAVYDMKAEAWRAPTAEEMPMVRIGGRK